MEEKLEQLRRKLCEQTTDLVNKAGVPPLVLSTMILDLAVALPISMGVPPADIALSLRAHAVMLDRLDHGEGLGTHDASAWN